MKKIYRVTSNEDFATCVHKGVTRKDGNYTVHAIANKFGYTRVGISASKKLGVAVVRNRVRRQVRAMCGEILDFEKYGIDIVIVIRDNFLKNKFEENKNSLQSLIKSITERK